MPEPTSGPERTPRSRTGFSGLLRRMLSSLGRWSRGAGRPGAEPARPALDAAQAAAEALALALAEPAPVPRLARLRAALELCERLPGAAGDVMVMEASLHLGASRMALTRLISPGI